MESKESEEEVLARLVEEYHRRSAQGPRPDPGEFRAAAGPHFERFAEILRQEALLDDLLEGSAAERFPRTFGEYTLLELLGRGGIGNVYRALHRPLARTVALKVLQGGWADDAELIERFQRGARAAAQVEHPHVVRIHDVGVFEGRPFLAMTFVAGSDLGALFRRLRAIEEPRFGAAHLAALDEARVPGTGSDTTAFVRRLAALLAGPADALDLYHRAGILHRDVKPGNLLLDPGGRLILTDFDLARRFETNVQTASGGTLGTPGYMSPEQWDPLVADVDARSDVYSLGCVFYEGIVGRPPFHDAEDPARMMKRILAEAAPDAGLAVPDLPLAARRVLNKALERRREDRYPTAAALAEDLRALAVERAVAARPVPFMRRAVRRVRRHRLPLAAALAIAVIGLTLWWGRPAHVSILPWPAADVWMDGVALQRSPVKDRAVEAGEHDILLRRQGFADHRETLRLRRGEARTLDPRLRILDDKDPAVWEAILEAADVRPRDAMFPSARGTHEAKRLAFRPLLPRGKVRREDCLAFTLDVERSQEADLVVLDAGGAVVWQVTRRFEPPAARVPIGDDERALLKVGRAYQWGVRQQGTLVASAEFSVVRDLDLSSIRLLRADGHPGLADRLELSLLSSEGLFTAVVQRAEAGGTPGAESLVAGAQQAMGLRD